jgi:hypothetical protein
LASQRSGGFERDVRVVDVRGVQSHLRGELAKLTKQAISTPLRGGRWGKAKGEPECSGRSQRKDTAEERVGGRTLREEEDAGVTRSPYRVIPCYVQRR